MICKNNMLYLIYKKTKHNFVKRVQIGGIPEIYYRIYTSYAQVLQRSLKPAKMKPKNVISILILFFLLGCSDKKGELEYLICNDSIQYWNYNMIRDKQNVWFTFSFNKNGDVIKYSFNKKKNKRWFFDDNHVPGYGKWNVSKDSIFSFMGSSMKIIRYSEDTIYVKDVETNANEYFIRAKGDLHIIEDKPAHNSGFTQ